MTNLPAEPDLWALWPDGTVCALAEKGRLAELLTWMSDDYEVKQALGYDGCGFPVFGVAA